MLNAKIFKSFNENALVGNISTDQSCPKRSNYDFFKT